MSSPGVLAGRVPMLAMRGAGGGAPLGEAGGDAEVYMPCPHREAKRAPHTEGHVGPATQLAGHLSPRCAMGSFARLRASPGSGGGGVSEDTSAWACGLRESIVSWAVFVPLSSRRG